MTVTETLPIPKSQPMEASKQMLRDLPDTQAAVEDLLFGQGGLIDKWGTQGQRGPTNVIIREIAAIQVQSELLHDALDQVAVLRTALQEIIDRSQDGLDFTS